MDALDGGKSARSARIVAFTPFLRPSVACWWEDRPRARTAPVGEGESFFEKLITEYHLLSLLGRWKLT
jgi:hypothetical protein